MGGSRGGLSTKIYATSVLGNPVRLICSREQRKDIAFAHALVPTWKLRGPMVGGITPLLVRLPWPFQDFLEALATMPAAKAFVETLDRKNLYPIYYRLHTAKRSEKRAKRMAQILAQLDPRTRGPRKRQSPHDDLVSQTLPRGRNFH